MVLFAWVEQRSQWAGVNDAVFWHGWLPLTFVYGASGSAVVRTEPLHSSFFSGCRRAGARLAESARRRASHARCRIWISAVRLTLARAASPERRAGGWSASSCRRKVIPSWQECKTDSLL